MTLKAVRLELMESSITGRTQVTDLCCIDLWRLITWCLCTNFSNMLMKYRLTDSGIYLDECLEQLAQSGTKDSDVEVP